VAERIRLVQGDNRPYIRMTLRQADGTAMDLQNATSVVVLRANGFSSWDRGFNAVDMQVWGATAGPYLFARRVPIESAPRASVPPPA
jgi:hypothetical protein